MSQVAAHRCLSKKAGPLLSGPIYLYQQKLTLKPFIRRIADTWFLAAQEWFPNYRMLDWSA